jgi:hypothetical protein
MSSGRQHQANGGVVNATARRPQPRQPFDSAPFDSPGLAQGKQGSLRCDGAAFGCPLIFASPYDRCSSALIRFSVGGWLLKRLKSAWPENGWMMNMCAVAGLASSGMRLAA